MGHGGDDIVVNFPQDWLDVLVGFIDYDAQQLVALVLVDFELTLADHLGEDAVATRVEGSNFGVGWEFALGVFDVALCEG